VFNNGPADPNNLNIVSVDGNGNKLNNTTPNEFFKPHAEAHKIAGGEYIKSIIYGGLDGIVSVFVAVAAVSGTNVGIGLVLVLGFAKLFAGGLSMGVGDWLSTDAEVDLAKRERRREEWECDNFLEGEIEEMVELYKAKGIQEDVAREIIVILARNRKVFVDVMMAEELGIPPDVSSSPWKHGLINFGSFMFFGIIPLLAYLIIIGIQATTHTQGGYVFYISIAMTIVTLFLMGLIKAKLTGTEMMKSALITTVFGAFTAFIGWIVGFILDKSVGVTLVQ